MTASFKKLFIFFFFTDSVLRTRGAFHLREDLQATYSVFFFSACAHFGVNLYENLSPTCFLATRLFLFRLDTSSFISFFFFILSS